MVHVKTPNQLEIPDTAAMRCGVQRQSMRTNVLIHRAGLSEVNKLTFANPSAEKVFGVPKMADPEGARDVTTLWKSHQANPNDIPGAIYLANECECSIKLYPGYAPSSGALAFVTLAHVSTQSLSPPSLSLSLSIASSNCEANTIQAVRVSACRPGLSVDEQEGGHQRADDGSAAASLP